MKNINYYDRNVLNWVENHSNTLSRETYSEIISILQQESPELFEEKKRGRKNSETLPLKDIFNKELFGKYTEQELLLAIHFLPFYDTSSKGLAKTAYSWKCFGIVNKNTPPKALYYLFRDILNNWNIIDDKNYCSDKSFFKDYKKIIDEVPTGDNYKDMDWFTEYPICERFGFMNLLKSQVSAMIKYLDNKEYLNELVFEEDEILD